MASPVKSRALSKRPRKRRRGRSAKYKATGTPTITIENRRIVMLLPRRLRSPNRRGGWRAEYGERQAWKKLLAEARLQTDDSIGIPVIQRMRLEIMRLAPNKRYAMDHDNLFASAKRLIDGLREFGYIVNDDARWLDGPAMSQGIAKDKCYWCIVKLSVAEPYSESLVEVMPAEEAARKLTARARLRYAA